MVYLMQTFTTHFWTDTRRFTVLENGAPTNFGNFATKAAAHKAVRRSAADLDEEEGVDFVIVG